MCGYVDKILSFYFIFLSFLYPLLFLQKVWTGGQIMKILKKVSISLISYLKSVDMFFFLPCSLPTVRF